jgi:hypothetical protein
LLRLFGPAAYKKNINFKNVRVAEGLAIELRFSATGESYHSMTYLFKVSKPSVSLIIPQVCEALMNTLDTYVKVHKGVPKSSETGHID